MNSPRAAAIPWLFAAQNPRFSAIANHPRAELLFGHLGRSVAGSVVHHDSFELDAPACAERPQARAQQLLPVPVHDHHGDQPIMLAVLWRRHSCLPRRHSCRR